MRYPPSRTPFSDELAAVPVHFPNPTVTVPIDRLRSFRNSYEEMGKWISRMCGVEFKTLCTLDMLRFEAELADLKRKVAANDPSSNDPSS